MFLMGKKYKIRIRVETAFVFIAMLLGDDVNGQHNALLISAWQFLVPLDALKPQI